MYVGRADSGRLYTEPADIPNLDHHPDLVATELLYYLAEEARKANMLPIRDPLIVGMAWTMEAHGATLEMDAPLFMHDQLDAARKARELHRWPDAVECRTISAVLCDGTEGSLIRHRDGEVWLSLGPQHGLVYRSLRVLCGLPETNPTGTPTLRQLV